MTTSDLDAGVGEALRRSAVYRLLAGTFAPPEPAMLAGQGRCAETLARELPELAEQLGRLAQAVTSVEPGELEAEHMRLFSGQVRCPPYEGAYGPPQLGGKGAQLADVAGFYAAFGLAPAAAQPEVEDHIGAELEFMSVLALKEASALAEGRPDGLEITRHAQASFLTDHLGRWVEPLADRLRAEASGAYYRAAAAALVAWIEVEALRLEVCPTPVPRSRSNVDEPDAFTCPMTPAEVNAASPPP